MGRREKIKIVVIALLSFLVITLLYFYVSSNEDPASANKVIQNINELSNDKIKQSIDSIISTFGIKKEWNRDVRVKEKDPKIKSEPIWISNEILIPLDLPVIDLNYEISNYLRSNNFDEKVTEDPKTKNISINIFSSKDSIKKAVGNLKFIYSDSIKRRAAEVCIVLDSLDSYNLPEVEKILSSTQEFSVFLPLRNDKADYQSMIIDMKKDYLLKFSIGEGEDIETDFKNDMKENVWKSKVKSFYQNFPQVTGIILLDKKGLNDFCNDVAMEFAKNNLKIYKDSLFSRYKKDENKIASLFDDIKSKSNNGKKFLFYKINFNPNEFSDYDREIYVMKKLGYKFLDFKEIIKRIDKSNEKLTTD